MFDFNENTILGAILIFIWIEFLWENYLSMRQLKVYRTITKLPDELKDLVTDEEFEKARLYGLDKIRFSIIKELYSVLLTTVVLYYKLIYYAWQLSEDYALRFGFTKEHEIIITCIFSAMINVASYFLSLHFLLYNTFVLEEKHGFNKQTIGFFIKDQLKSIALSMVLTLVLISAAIYIIKLGGDMFVFWLWLFTTIVSLVLLTIYPTIIAPLFDKITPLPEGTLRTSIEELASSQEFPLSQINVVEGSKRSAHSNAYFAGLFGTRRIVLFDTLIEKFNEKKNCVTGCTEKEILGILAHELGHWKKMHIIKSLVISEVNLFLLFAVFAILFKYSMLYTALGFPAGQQPVIIGLFAVLQLVLAPYNAFLSYIMTILSRKFEYEADDFAFDLDYATELKSSLIKLGKDNLDYPVYDKMYSSWYHSHPTLLHRIQNINSKLIKNE